MKKSVRKGSRRAPGEAPAVRLLFGDIIRAKGWATAEQILECLNVQRIEDEAGQRHRRLGEILVAGGYLTRAQLRKVETLL